MCFIPSTVGHYESHYSDNNRCVHYQYCTTHAHRPFLHSLCLCQQYRDLSGTKVIIALSMFAFDMARLSAEAFLFTFTHNAALIGRGVRSIPEVKIKGLVMFYRHDVPIGHR